MHQDASRDLRRTTYRMTRLGRSALRPYLASMQSLIDAIETSHQA